MNYEILNEIDQVSNYVGDVSAIADRNKNSFGFLSSTAYEQMATKGQLWIAVNSKRELVGYLMFGGTMPTLKVFQLYASESVKGQGVGRLLIDVLIEFARKRHFHTISARVASDLQANGFWEKIGFKIFRQVKGGDVKKRIINIRGYSLSENDLFGDVSNRGSVLVPSAPVLQRAIYVLDLNLLLDIFKGRPGHEKVMEIMRAAFKGLIDICITPELKKELERHAQKFADDPVLRWAQVFPELKKGASVSAIVDSLRGIVFPNRSPDRKSAKNDDSDLMHLAYCMSAGVTGFVTREKALLKACDQIRDRFGFSILSPDEIILDGGDVLDFHAPVSADFSLGSSSRSDEVKRFLDAFSAPDLIMELIFMDSPIREGVSVYEARIFGTLFGVYFFKKPVKSDGLALACLYVDETFPNAIAVIDHFLAKALRYRCGFSYRLDVYVGKGQDLTGDTLKKKGFFRCDDCFVKFNSELFLNEKNWGRFAIEFNRMCGFSVPEKIPKKMDLLNTGVSISDGGGPKFVSWFDFETIISPGFILNRDRGCIIVPIRENYANSLIGNLTGQISLLESGQQMFVLEKAYFRSARNASIFKRGGIVAFYVSGVNSIQEIIGFARITYSDVVSIDEAIVRLGRQGVLSWDELSEISDKSGKIHVFTFDNFVEFDNRVSIIRGRKIGVVNGANLVSPQEIDSEKLNTLIGEAFNV